MKSTTVTLHTPANGLRESIAFYRQLNFQVVSEAEPTLMSDGQILVEIEPARTARAGLKMYGRHWTGECAKLREFTAVVPTGSGFLASDPNGVWVYLSNGPLKDCRMPEVKTGITGRFAGLSIEAVDLERTCGFWECLGYKVSKGSAEQGWVSLSNNTSVDISIIVANRCPHLFFNPSMTFFNGSENVQVIEKVRNAGVPITEQITAFSKDGSVENIIIRDPGGYGIFIFND